MSHSNKTLNHFSAMFWILFANLALVSFLFPGQIAQAQRLVIHSIGVGPVAKVIYGRIEADRFWLFEKEYLLESSPVEELAPTSGGSAVTEPHVEAQIPSGDDDRSGVLTSFAMSRRELEKCTNSPRFSVLIALLKSIKGKIDSIIVQGEGEASECQDEIVAEIRKLVPRTSRNAAAAPGLEGIRVEVRVRPNNSDQAGDSSGVAKAERPHPMDDPNAARPPRVEIDGTPITIQADGWFAAEFDTSSQKEVVIDVYGRKPQTVTIAPQIISSQVSKVLGGVRYQERIASWNMPASKLELVPIPLLEQQTAIEGGIGGGVGYGREVPGERRGARTVSLVAIERRNWFRDVGAKGSIFYTRAPSTVVPQTLTLRGLSFMDFAIGEGFATMRLGVGGEFFQAKIKPSDIGILAQEPVFVPEQVAAPLTSLGFQSLMWDRVVFAPILAFSPLYVPSYGFYPAFSPSFDLGVRVFNKWLILFQFGSETHRFPNPLADTRLQLDYGILSLRRGLF